MATTQRPVDVFRALHHGRSPDDPLVLPGPWDAASARALVTAGFPALATPSAGIAASLGYEDGSTPPAEMFAAVARIVRAVRPLGAPPVSADVEGGYGLPPAELVERLLETGVVGCNLEDTGPDGTLRDPRQHADWLAEVRAAAGDRLFLNARVDTFVRGVRDPAAAVDRARAYVAAGADCVYPILAPRSAIAVLRAGVDGPLNVVAEVSGPAHALRGSLRELGGLGATRITFGPGLLHRATAALGDLATQLR
ncbi:isocitrate lyase/phosphoenolpyruvate mutase family protein [Streptomyces sp. NPDC005955]|uniref:isocitrate lyase/PEP mutase family protein n=1 Tax=Streptomyces sp. NPDC005955 TaxID=3364738 RepID=UPI0036A7E165